MGEIEHPVVGRVGGLGDLLAHHLLFADEIIRRQGRPSDQVGADFKPELEDVGHAAHLEAGAFIARGGVDLPPLGFDGLDNIVSSAIACALEHHVLQEVRPAELLSLLPACAAVHHHRQTDAFQARHGVGDHPNAVGESMQSWRGVVAARCRRSVHFRTAPRTKRLSASRSAARRSKRSGLS